MHVVLGDAGESQEPTCGEGFLSRQTLSIYVQSWPSYKFTQKRGRGNR